MLVLTRKVGEQLVIGGGITVTVVSAQGGKVRLGVTAPPEVRVDRAEVRARPAARRAAGPPARGCRPRPIQILDAGSHL